MTLQPPQPSRHRTTDSQERNYQQIRVRQDTNTNWLKNNPIPASGEWCYSIGPKNPPTIYTPEELPPASEETYGQYALVEVDNTISVWKCLRIGQNQSGEDMYAWRPDPENVDYVFTEYPDQCIKIGDGNTRWSELAWLGGRGQQGQTGDQGPEGPPGIDGTGSIAYRTIEITSVDKQKIFPLPIAVQPSSSFVTINGVVLSPSNYTLQVLNLTLETGIDTKAGDNVSIFSWIGAVDFETLGLTTADIATLGERPSYVKAVAREDLNNQQDVNWYLLERVDELEAPDAIDLPENIATTDDITAAVEGLASEAWVTEAIDDVEIPSIDGLATKDYVDNQDQVVQEWVENKNYLIDEGQNTQIDTLENKVKALEGTVVEAQYKADARDDPQIGSFVLKNMLNEKVLQFNQAAYIILSETDFTNKPIDASKVMAGDIVRLVMSPSNYANFTVTSVANRNGNINLEVTFGSAGPEGIVFDGAVYDFTHTTPFDIGAACTKQYSDDQDAVTLKAAQDYADALDIPDAVVTDSFLSDEGEQHIKPEWKIRDPNKAYTYITIAPSGGMGLYHLKAPESSHHAVPVSYLEDVCFNSITNTLNLRSEESDHVKISCSDSNDWAPQNNEKNILRGNYKSNGGSLSEWSFGFNQYNQYWQYDWDMGNSNCCMTWHVKGDKKFTIDTSGAKMANAYIVRDTDFSGVAEEDYEAVSQAAVEIDIGHRLRELKNILVNLKTALKTKSADAQQALLDVLEHVEDI